MIFDSVRDIIYYNAKALEWEMKLSAHEAMHTIFLRVSILYDHNNVGR